MEKILNNVLDENHFFEFIHDKIYISTNCFTLTLTKLEFYEIITWIKKTQVQINNYLKLGSIHIFPFLLQFYLFPLCKHIVKVYITYDNGLYFNIKYYNLEAVSFDVITIAQLFHCDIVLQQLV